MKNSAFLSLLLLPLSLIAQDCTCSSQLNEVIAYFEQNNPAFQEIKSDGHAYNVYKKELKGIKKGAGKIKDADLCIVYLDRYVTLLKDHHSGIGFNLARTDLGTDERVAAFKGTPEYLRFKKISIDTAVLIPSLMKMDKESIEGIYSDGRSIVFGIIAGERMGKYTGVILRPTKLFEPGHVLLELTRIGENTYDVIYNIGLLGFNFQKIYKRLEIKNGQIPSFGFSKISTTANPVIPYEFRVLNETTNYLRLKSFDYRLTNDLNLFYTSIDSGIKSKPFLVIDLRNNGGGSEASYYNLLPYAYTRPFHIDQAQVWVSPENIRRYEESPQQNHLLVTRMKAAKPFTFIPQVTDAMDTWTMDSSLVFPKKIILLFNRGTASAAEGMILYFMQSDKVITMGENSGGYIGYGNVMTARTGCGKFTVQSTTIKYPEKSKYEFVGIEPMHTPPGGTDWISYATELLRKGD